MVESLTATDAGGEGHHIRTRALSRFHQKGTPKGTPTHWSDLIKRIFKGYQNCPTNWSQLIGNQLLKEIEMENTPILWKNK